MAVAAVRGETGVVSTMVENHTICIYFCDQKCAAEHADFASNKAGAHHECMKCERWTHQALLSKCTECAKYFHLTCNQDQNQFGHKQCSKACEQTAQKHIQVAQEYARIATEVGKTTIYIHNMGQSAKITPSAQTDDDLREHTEYDMMPRPLEITVPHHLQIKLVLMGMMRNYPHRNSKVVSRMKSMP
jgi:hypothetical protein